mmetsp:Transcript_97085/g.251082  ORF Transcript_97085/g.251082 Transcript_97085/m.251082 type:complete len:290 (+) Transcript_97085:224-1093(+)
MKADVHHGACGEGQPQWQEEPEGLDEEKGGDSQQGLRHTRQDGDQRRERSAHAPGHQHERHCKALGHIMDRKQQRHVQPELRFQLPTEGHPDCDTLRGRMKEHHNEDEHGLAEVAPLHECAMQRDDVRVLALALAWVQALAGPDEDHTNKEAHQDLPIFGATMLVRLRQHAGRGCQHHAARNRVRHCKRPLTQRIGTYKHEGHCAEAGGDASEPAVQKHSERLVRHPLQQLHAYDNSACSNPQRTQCAQEHVPEGRPCKRLGAAGGRHLSRGRGCSRPRVRITSTRLHR